MGYTWISLIVTIAVDYRLDFMDTSSTVGYISVHNVSLEAMHMQLFRITVGYIRLYWWRLHMLGLHDETIHIR